MPHNLPAYVNGQLVNCDSEEPGMVFRRNCTACTRKRRKCDGHVPQCARCFKSKEDCIYVLDKVRTSVKEKNTSTLETPLETRVRFPSTSFIPVFSNSSPENFEPLEFIHNYQVSPILSVFPNENQLRARKDSVTHLIASDGQALNCDNLCLRFLHDFVEYVPPGLTITPFSYLPPHEVYDNLRETFLERPMDGMNKHPLFFAPLPLDKLRNFTADFYIYMEIAILGLNHSQQIDAVRADVILILLVGLLLLRNVDTDPGNLNYMTANFDRILPDLIFRYLGKIGVGTDTEITLDWTAADVLFLRRVWYFWNLIDLEFSLLRFRSPIATQKLPSILSPQSAQDSVKSLFHMAMLILQTPLERRKPTPTLDPKADTPQGTLRDLWEIGKEKYIGGYASASVVLEIWGQVVSWRLYEQDVCNPLAVTFASPLHPSNEKRRYFEAILDAWRHNDVLLPFLHLGLKPDFGGIFPNEKSPFSYKGTGFVNGQLMSELEPAMQLETSWLSQSAVSAGVINGLMFLYCWQFVVFPDVVHVSILLDMMKRKANGRMVGVTSQHVEHVLIGHVQLLQSVTMVYSRLLYLHRVSEQCKKQRPGHYLDFTILESALSTPPLRQAMFVTARSIIQLFQIMLEGRKMTGDVMVDYQFVQKDGITLEITKSGSTTLVKPDFSDYSVIGKEYDVLKLISFFCGDGHFTNDLDDLVDKVMIQTLQMLAVLLQVIQIQVELGYGRSKHGLVYLWDVMNQAGVTDLSRSCQVWMELPLD